MGNAVPDTVPHYPKEENDAKSRNAMFLPFGDKINICGNQRRRIVMNRYFAKAVCFFIVVLMLLPTTMVFASGESFCVEDENHSEDTRVINCNHVFVSNYDWKYVKISETQHGFYEIKNNICMKCGYNYYDLLKLIGVSNHVIDSPDGFIGEINGERIYCGTCTLCGETGQTTP